MKKLFLICCLLSVCGAASYAQNGGVLITSNAEKTDTLLPYQKNPTLPAFNIRAMDSTTIFNTYNIPGGNPIGILFFDPECKHCRHTIKGLLEHMDSVSNVQFYMISPIHMMTRLRDFYNEYKLADYKNIKLVGNDYEFFFFGHYAARSVPDVALYDGRKKLIKLIQGEFTATDIYKAIH